MINHITKRPLWFNILVAIGIVALVVFIFILLLGVITRHGEAKTVPAVTGKNINEVTELLSNGGFETVIQDSVFYDSLPPGIVIKQVPEADQVVKVNRTVYVWINRFVAPDIPMPNLNGFSFRNAEMTLNNLGLRLGDTVHRPDFAKGSVLEMLLNGKTLKPGDKVKEGSMIDLVVAGGLSNEDIAVPKLTGLTLAEARIRLEASGMSIDILPIPGAGVTDQENAYVWRQDPQPKTADGVQIRIRSGQSITVWLQNDPPPAEDSTRQEPPTQIPEQ